MTYYENDSQFSLEACEFQQPVDRKGASSGPAHVDAEALSDTITHAKGMSSVCKAWPRRTTGQAEHLE